MIMPNLDIASVVASLRSSGREDLLHYAGAAHRDPVAHRMCVEYLADPTASETDLKTRALKAVHGWDV